jgi:tetratricopeptide (TPR) repeat protein
MRTVKIFIASSSELKNDRDEFRLFISQQNDRLHKQDIYLQIVQWENFLDAISNTQLQDEYNKAISDCDIVLCLFFTKVGKYTAEEFDTAYQVFKDKGTPKIWTYFKNANISTSSITDEINTLITFKKRIKDLGHFHTEYTGIDNLLNQYRSQLDEFLQPIVENLNVRASDTSENVNEIKNYLIRLESKIAILTSKADTTHQQEDITAINSELENLKIEKDLLKKQLAQRDDIIESQKKSQEELEKLLTAEKEKDTLKEEALQAVEQKDYNKADKLLQEAAKERIEKVADDFYQIGIVKELKMEFAEAFKYFKLAAEIPPHKQTYLVKAADLSRTFGYLNQCIEYLTEAIDIEINEGTDKLAIYYNNLGLAWQDKGDLDKAIDYLEKALEIDLKLSGEENPKIATYYNNLGLAWKDKGDLDKAIEYFEKALKIGLKLFGEENPSIATYYNNLGLVWLDKGNLDNAIEYLEKALKIDLKLSGEENPKVATYYNNLGLTWQDKGNMDKAIDYFKKALKIDLKLFGEENRRVAIRYNNLGLAWKDRGNLNKAIEYLEKALKIDLKLFGEENPKIAIYYNNLGLAWQDKTDLEKAIDYLQKALKIDLKSFGEENPKIAIRYNNLGMAWKDKGRLDKAIAYLEKAYIIFIKFYGEHNPSTITVKQNYDNCLNKKNSA